MQGNQNIYIETYGCQMNLADTEVILRIMTDAGFHRTYNIAEADVILINTCAVRDNAEQRVLGRLGDFSTHKKHHPSTLIGVLGCMAERMYSELLKTVKYIDFITGPDEYRKLPELIEIARRGKKGIAVDLSLTETYSDIAPLRTDSISAWISIMRGCDNFCSYCVVPFTRGRERSCPKSNILSEIEYLSDHNYKEVTLLGQNVNSYRDGNSDFADLLTEAADIDRSIRVRFTTSHPRDMSEKLINAIASKTNICNYIHLPVQSGSDKILGLMNRGYAKNEYLNLIRKIKEMIPEIGLSTDIIAGFPGETENDHEQTLDLLYEVEFDSAFTFKYSPRENTKAFQLSDSVPENIKLRRLDEIINAQRIISSKRNSMMIGRTVEVLIEGPSKKSALDFCGRTGTNKMVVFQKNGDSIGDYININIERANSATLFGVHTTYDKNQNVTNISTRGLKS